MIADNKRIFMSETGRLARWHEILKDPIRQKILLKLGEHDKLSFDELIKELKTDDQEELYNELQILGDLVTKAKDEDYSPSKEGVLKTFSDQYMLTEEGHNAVDEMIAFPEIESDNYNNTLDKDGKPKQKSWMPMIPNWEILFFTAIVIATAIIVVLLLWYFHINARTGQRTLSFSELKFYLSPTYKLDYRFETIL
jgi:hypothetical protein